MAVLVLLLRRLLAFLITLAALAASRPVRVRREIRSLSEAERKDFFWALWETKRHDLDEGVALYGPRFKPYDYFVLQHVSAVLDPRGDQAHFTPSFMTFHRAFLMEMEATLLDILATRNSSSSGESGGSGTGIGIGIGGIPYWDFSLDSDTGPYYLSEDEYLFSAAFLGSLDGDATEGYAVADGQVAHWPVSQYDAAAIAGLGVPPASVAYLNEVYRGSAAPAPLLRSANNTNAAGFLTRFPTPRGAPFPTMDRRGGLDYGAGSFASCASWRQGVRDWMGWQECVENGRAPRRADNASAAFDFVSGLAWLHSQPHVKVGSWDENSSAFGAALPCCPVDFARVGPLAMGDFFDLATSPNDPLFLLHHANVDRLNVRWQRAALVAAGPAILAAGGGRAWGYPASYEAWRNATTSRAPDFAWLGAIDGTLLDDVASSNFPFYKEDLFPSSEDEDNGATDGDDGNYDEGGGNEKGEREKKGKAGQQRQREQQQHRHQQQKKLPTSAPLTHRQILALTDPGIAPYTYDSFT